jgi:hypothetical protein
MNLITLLLIAQVAPGIFTTVKTTNTSGTSIQVGCAVGSSSCTGGIVAGPVDVSQVITAGAITIASNVPGTTMNKLYNNGGTLTWAGSALALGGAVGPGTAGKIAKFTGANAVGDSICSEAGTTITCVNTVAATTGTFTTLTGTLTAGAQGNITTANGITSASSLATVGTITSGTWQGTIIDITRGGAGVSLAATGGTSQFLRQNSVGATISVVRPAVSDLSDSSNVALLAASNAFTGAVNGNLRQSYFNNNNGTAALAGWQAQSNSTSAFMDAFSPGFTTASHAIAASARFMGDGAAGVNIVASNATGTIGLWTNALLRWSVNASGHFIPNGGNTFDIGDSTNTIRNIFIGGLAEHANGTTGAPSITFTSDPDTGFYRFGANAISVVTNGTERWGIDANGNTMVGGSITESVGTPVLSSGGGSLPTLSGRDYAFAWTWGGTPTAVTLNFGNTWTVAPICVATPNTNVTPRITAISTTQITFTSSTLTAGDIVYIHCKARF